MPRRDKRSVERPEENDHDEIRRRNEGFRNHRFERGEYSGWFEDVYAASAGRPQEIPWARLSPNPLFQSWAGRQRLKGEGRPALVVGCGLGDDAEALAALGFSVTAFDISGTAVNWCRQRFPDSGVDWREADIFNPPESWNGAFSFVLEISTLQALPAELRPRAMHAVARFLQPGGTALVVAFARMPSDEPDELPPWPLLADEFQPFIDSGLTEIRREILPVKSRSWCKHRFRIEFHKG